MLLTLVLAVSAGLLARGQGQDGAPVAPSFRETTPLPVLRAAAAPPEQVPMAEPQLSGSEARRDLVDTPWRMASTGWQVLADRDTPLPNTSFLYGPMVVAGETFIRGLATYPFSEIVYELERADTAFSARVGVTDDSKNGAGSVRFFVYGDELLLYQSGVLTAGQPALPVEISVRGARLLRLIVDDGGDGSEGDYALWAAPSLWASGESAADPSEIDAFRANAPTPQVAQAQERAAVEARVEQDRAAVATLAGQGREARGGFDASSSLIALSNDRLAVTLGYGGQRNGRLSVMRRGATAPTLLDLAPSLTTTDGRTLRLPLLRPEVQRPPQPERVTDPHLGAGLQVTARFVREGEPGVAAIRLSVYDGEPRLFMELLTEGFRLAAVRYFERSEGLLFLGDDLQYLTDRSHLYRGQVWPDGHARRAPLEATKPALLWSDTGAQGLLLSLVDWVASPAWLSLQHPPGSGGTALSLGLAALLGDFGPDANRSPALSIELTDGTPSSDTFRRYRGLMAARYAEVAWPADVRFQWGSWYVFGPSADADGMTRQIDLVARSFGDLGRWQIMLDAGWHVQYARPGSELGAVDFDKFPDGIRAVSDAAHGRGFDLVLYLGTGFIHDNPADGGEWLALLGLIEQHPDWLIPFQQTSARVHRYLLDYQKPEVRAYLAGVLSDFFNVHDVDGINLDGLADAEGQLIPRIERDGPHGPLHPLLPSLDVYRLVRDEADRHKPGAFIESGWVNPMAANSLAQVFRYADETDLADSPYPFGGFLQHLDYAIYSRLALGQRGYVGTATGDPAEPHSRWWVQAASALGAHAALSFNLEWLTPQAAAAHRADLQGLHPFSGVTSFGPGLFPDVFATTSPDGMIFLGVVNREPQARSINVPLSRLHLPDDAPHLVFDTLEGDARPVDGDFALSLPGKSFRLLTLRRQPGVLSTTSSMEPVELLSQGIRLTVHGPSEVPGLTVMAAPEPSSVSIDGRALERGETAESDTRYRYDAPSGALFIAYSHGNPREIDVRW